MVDPNCVERGVNFFNSRVLALTKAWIARMRIKVALSPCNHTPAIDNGLHSICKIKNKKK